MIRLSLFMVGLFAANGALAQTAVTNFQMVLLSPQNITQANCSDKLKFSLNLTVTPQTANEILRVKVFAVVTTTDNSARVCPNDVPIDTNILAGTAQDFITVTTQNAQAPFSRTLSEADFNNPTVESMGVCDTATSPANNTFALCAYMTPNQNTNSQTSGSPSTPGIFASVNTTPPTIEVSDVNAQDEKIGMTVTTNQNETGFHICYITNSMGPAATLDPILDTTDACPAPARELLIDLGAGSNGSADDEKSSTITWGLDADGNALANGTTYHFLVRGNTGGLWNSVVQHASPVARYSTLKLYQGSNSGVSWQCAQSDAPLSFTALFGLIAMLAIAFALSPTHRRKVRKLFAGLFIVAILFASQDAGAYAGQFDLGLTGTFYKPNLDKGTTFPVYQCLYDGAWVPKLGLDFDFHVWDPFGSFQLGIGANFAWANGSALVNDHQGETTCPANDKSTSKIGLNMLQLTPHITYVLDEFIDSFPLAPYIQVGFPMTGYYFTYQGDPDKKGQSIGNNPMGIKFGWQFTIGMMFLLDVLEPGTSAAARTVGTYSHTYLKTGLTYMSVNDFGRPGYDFSPAQFGKDLPLQLDFAIVFEFQ